MEIPQRGESFGAFLDFIEEKQCGRINLRIKVQDCSKFGDNASRIKVEFENPTVARVDVRNYIQVRFEI